MNGAAFETGLGVPLSESPSYSGHLKVTCQIVYKLFLYHTSSETKLLTNIRYVNQKARPYQLFQSRSIFIGVAASLQTLLLTSVSINCK